MTIQRTGLGTTGLGAVGGPRGVAAGGLRIILEFLTQYDAKAVKQVKADISSLAAQAKALDAQELSRTRSLSAVQTKISQAQAIVQAKLTRDQRNAFRESQRLRETGSAADLKKARQLQAQTINAAVASNRITAQQGQQLARQAANLNREKKLRQDILSIQQKQENVAKQTTDQQRNLSFLERARQNIGGRLSGLAVGALGGLVGGAVVGIGFSAIQGILDAVGEKAQDIIDPARHAREALQGIADAINAIGSSEGVDTLEATAKFLQQIGVNGDQVTKATLARAAAEKAATDALNQQLAVQEILRHSDDQRQQNLKLILELLRQTGQLPSQQPGAAGGGLLPRGSVSREQALNRQEIANTTLAAKDQQAAVDYLNKLLDTLAQNSRDAANAQAVLEAQARATAIALQQASAFSDLRLSGAVGAISGAIGSKISALQAKASGLDNSKGAGTSALQNQIDALQQGRANAQFNKQLASLREERELLLLKQRLKLLGENINLEKFQGKFLLVAIDAKIAALQKEGEAQDRLNKLQDIERAAANADKLRRNEGESIADFVERRAEANQQVLRDRQQMERDDAINHLQAIRDQTQDELDLAKNLQDQKDLIAEKAYQDQVNRLQKQLAAQQSAANDGLKAQKEAIQKEIEAWQHKLEVVQNYTDQQKLYQISSAIGYANSIGDLAALTGEIQGLRQAKGFIEALVKAGLITPQEAANSLAGINAVLGQADAKAKALGLTVGSRPTVRGRGGVPDVGSTGGRGQVPAAHGGVFALNNGSTVFGSHIRTGEQGTELGVILSHSVVKALRQSPSGPSAQFGDIYIDRSSNPQAEEYRVKRAVKSALQEML